MGRARRVLRAEELTPVERPDLPLAVRRRRPRSYPEWATLRRWGRLPAWEDEPPGYRLRLLREQAGLTQLGLAGRLGCSQQAVAQAERWESNPSVAFMASWAAAVGRRLELRFPVARPMRRVG